MVHQEQVTTPARREILFIHGYTGGPTDFANLPEVLRERYGAAVHCPLLPGHGTRVEDLLGLKPEDLYGGVEAHLAQSLREGTQVVVVGLSLGAQAALYLASKYPVAGVVAIATTHGLLFPFNIPGAGLLRFYRRIWKKVLSAEDREARRNAVYYDAMPIDGLFVSRALRKLVAARARRITQPVLFVHSAHETLGSPRAVKQLAKEIPGKTAVRFFTEWVHSMFFSSVREHLIDEVAAFIERENLFSPPPRTKAVSAVVPAYHEAVRIRPVLEALHAAPSIDDIVVIDDGGTDNLAAVVREFPRVTFLRHERNLGKGASMEHGVAAAKHECIFFCDADLVGFTAAHAEAIVRPVLEGRYDMFIGMRGNFMQRAVRTWGLNSGERALHKTLWNKLPARYKHRYRIETALNYFVARTTQRGFGWALFDYTQPLKERKYGLFWGTLLRWSMNADIARVYLEIIVRTLPRSLGILK
jgi:esterase/lipase